MQSRFDRQGSPRLPVLPTISPQARKRKRMVSQSPSGRLHNLCIGRTHHAQSLRAKILAWRCFDSHPPTERRSTVHSDIAEMDGAHRPFRRCTRRTGESHGRKAFPHLPSMATGTPHSLRRRIYPRRTRQLHTPSCPGPNCERLPGSSILIQSVSTSADGFEGRFPLPTEPSSMGLPHGAWPGFWLAPRCALNPVSGVKECCVTC
jgi:hypothetical protein